MASRKRLMSGWDPVPARSAVKAAAIAEPVKRAPARKDTRTWCKGKEGREHQPVIVFRPGWSRKPLACEWASYWIGQAVKWHCHHEEHCGRCGKVLRPSLAAGECPGYPGSDAQKAQAEADAVASAERAAAWRAGRRRVITGPQGYRRKRESA